ncbi:DNA ligase D [Undibacter mobilis]|uniref:DNA ligase (ATP) n=1 Tax=Undibacter mobilis TaxID=2292256 RepID=A0A371B2V9_9BRAD|nr:DNA ligase D [Undibacter mobilis]RDV01925.1 DNA ligase D [Undibacter mobilis]
MAGLKTYRGKRRFGVTAEPKGKVARKRGHAYVIQKHAATRLHYDLRLELDGVMKSWAVTRGPSLVPSEKRLAVEVEDHPIDYNKFEGTIPKGEYGGGTVMVWDRGTWQPHDDPHKGLKKGHLAFDLEGAKLHGAWHLVRLRKRPGEKRNNWLLIKSDDEEARAPRDKDILKEADFSIKTGRSMDEIAQGKRATANEKSTMKKVLTATQRKMAALKNPGAKKTRTKAASAQLVQKHDTLSDRKASPLKGAKRAALPGFVAPCLATLADKAPDSAHWIHEIKFDGYRLQARLSRGKVKLMTRKGLDWTRKFTAIADAIAELDVDSALIDGELVVEGDDGVTSFSLLQEELKSGRQNQLVYYVFDLLHLDGRDLRPLPLSDRKEALAQLIKRAPNSSPLRFSESIAERGPILLKHACQLGLEGIISKRDDAAYHSGRGHDWIKTKCTSRQELVIAGFVPSTADAYAVGALVLGFHDKGKLVYAGRTGTGFTHLASRELYKKLKTLKRERTPFATVPAEERGVRTPIWVEPKLVAEVDFHGWTHGDRIRQASYQGLREDKTAADVVREDKPANKTIAAKSRTTARKRSAPVKKRASKDSKNATVGGIALSHPDRVYWEDAGVTKRDLAEYYKDVWTWMAPHVAGRPISLLRCPEGASGQCFFQKHAAAGIATEHLHLVPEKGDKIISVDNLGGLLSLVQAGVLEVHTRGTTVDDRENADRLVFDLDPGPGTTWKDVVAAARDVHERLDALKLKNFLKTSGGKGLHIVLPVAPTPWNKAKEFAQALAQAMAADDPDLYVATATKSKRKNRIFIDYLRNSREATAVAPYSTRARPGAAVSTPITWSELGSLKGADQYTLLNIRARLARLRQDPWAGIGRIRQKLPNA